jgi:hypothetical protein
MFKWIWNFFCKWNAYNVNEVKKGSALSLFALMFAWSYIALMAFGLLICLWFIPEPIQDYFKHLR